MPETVAFEPVMLVKLLMAAAMLLRLVELLKVSWRVPEAPPNLDGELASAGVDGGSEGTGRGRPSGPSRSRTSTFIEPPEYLAALIL